MPIAINKELAQLVKDRLDVKMTDVLWGISIDEAIKHVIVEQMWDNHKEKVDQIAKEVLSKVDRDELKKLLIERVSDFYTEKLKELEHDINY